MIAKLINTSRDTKLAAKILTGNSPELVIKLKSELDKLGIDDPKIQKQLYIIGSDYQLYLANHSINDGDKGDLNKLSKQAKACLLTYIGRVEKLQTIN